MRGSGFGIVAETIGATGGGRTAGGNSPSGGFKPALAPLAAAIVGAVASAAPPPLAPPLPAPPAVDAAAVAAAERAGCAFPACCVGADADGPGVAAGVVDAFFGPHAPRIATARTSDAEMIPVNHGASRFQNNDLIFMDPPKSKPPQIFAMKVRYRNAEHNEKTDYNSSCVTPKGLGVGALDAGRRESRCPDPCDAEVILFRSQRGDRIHLQHAASGYKTGQQADAEHDQRVSN